MPWCLCSLLFNDLWFNIKIISIWAYCLKKIIASTMKIKALIYEYILFVPWFGEGKKNCTVIYDAHFLSTSSYDDFKIKDGLKFNFHPCIYIKQLQYITMVMQGPWSGIAIVGFEPATCRSVFWSKGRQEVQ